MKIRHLGSRLAITLTLFIHVGIACKFGSVSGEDQTSDSPTSPVQIEVREENNDISLLFDGQERTIKLYFPPDYKSQNERPLLIVLHGGGGDADQIMRLTNIQSSADEFGFALALPNGSSPFKEKIFTWNSGHCCGFALNQDVDDIAFISALIDRMLLDFHVEPSRVYIAGISNGGMMALRAGAEIADKVTGVASISGTIGGQIDPNGEIILPSTPSEPVAVIVFHGKLDQHVLYEGGHGPKTSADRIDLGVQETLEFWSSANNCSKDLNLEQGLTEQINYYRYLECDEGGEIFFISIENGGHAWPGASKGYFSDEPTQEISASEMIFEFFSSP